MNHSLKILLLLLLSSCAGDYWNLQRSEDFVNEKEKNSKIICLEPQVTFRQAKKSVAEVDEFTARLEKLIAKSAAKNKVAIDIQSLDKTRSVLFYDRLLHLKKCISDVNFENYSSLYSNGAMKKNELTKSVYVYPPKLPHDFNTFSKLFSTKYFSAIKVTVYNESFSLQHILVDTDLCETVYNEKKTINKKFKYDLLAQVVYDSFYLLRRDFKNQ
jgi:hypothetical protein